MNVNMDSNEYWVWSMSPAFGYGDIIIAGATKIYHHSQEPQMWSIYPICLDWANKNKILITIIILRYIWTTTTSVIIMLKRKIKATNKSDELPARDESKIKIESQADFEEDAEEISGEE